MRLNQKGRTVVICFKFSNFAYANTVRRFISVRKMELLFALNLVTLLMQIQFFSPPFVHRVSCYLL